MPNTNVTMRKYQANPNRRATQNKLPVLLENIKLRKMETDEELFQIKGPRQT